MTEAPRPYTEQVKELDDLMYLAESSTKSIDEANAHLTKLKLNIFYLYAAIMLSCGGIAISFDSYIFYQKTGIKDSLMQGLAFVLSLSVLIIGSIGIFSNYYKYREKLRELKIENEIQSQVIDLIYEQKNRLKNKRILTSVADVTYNMRIRRLDRTKMHE